MKILELKDFMKQIESSTSIEDLDEIRNKADIPLKYQTSDIKYPKIDFQISPEDIQNLRFKKVLTNDNSFVLNQEELQTPLEKLLYAVLWKQGDLPKLKHVIEGILSTDKTEKDEQTNALVFYNFGKFLADEKEAIIDQHVLRAYGIYITDIKNTSKIEEYQKVNLINSNHKALIEDYKNWFKGLKINKDKETAFKIDRILMSIGKQMKKSKTNKDI